MNKRNEAIINAYEDSRAYDLYDVYETFSVYKARAWDRCKRISADYSYTGGRPDIADREPLKILGANCFQFSAGFRYETKYGETFFVYITKDGVREFKVD